MKKGLVVFLFIVLSTQFLSALVIVDGSIFLNNQTDHSDIKVLFEKLSPPTYKDSTYTNTLGYYSIDLE